MPSDTLGVPEGMTVLAIKLPSIMVRFCHAGARPPTGDHKTARRLLNDGNELDPGDSDTNQATGH